jgi:hypothetical protein
MVFCLSRIPVKPQMSKFGMEKGLYLAEIGSHFWYPRDLWADLPPEFRTSGNVRISI